MAEKLITKSFERLLDKGKHRGFITYEELGKSLGKRNSNNENIEKALIILVDEKITFVEKKSQYQSNKKKESQSPSEEKTSDKSDDPIRMYLREMGGVELLSREGEIAIAKRIEAGKDVMINALSIFSFVLFLLPKDLPSSSYVIKPRCFPLSKSLSNDFVMIFSAIF